MAGRRFRLMRFRKLLSKFVFTTLCLLYGLVILQNSSLLLEPVQSSSAAHIICNASRASADCNKAAGTHPATGIAEDKESDEVVQALAREVASEVEGLEVTLDEDSVTRNEDFLHSRLYNYPAVINQPLLCKAETDEGYLTSPFLLIIVHSHVLNVARRNAIRQTWARSALRYRGPLATQIVFLLGTAGEHDNSSVTKESSLYHDVLQWDFLDAYHNLTLKSMLGLSWAASFCPQARFILKTDDDVYLNISSILWLLRQKSERFYIIGNVNPSSNVMRVGQWGVSKDDYPSFTYPPYCSGAAYVMSRDAVSMVLRHAQFDRKVFPVEDVYITGILPHRFRLYCKHDQNFPKWETLYKADTVHMFLNNKLHGIHGVSCEKMYTMRRIVHECPTCPHNKTTIEEIIQQDEQYFNLYDDVEEGFTDHVPS